MTTEQWSYNVFTLIVPVARKEEVNTWFHETKEDMMLGELRLNQNTLEWAYYETVGTVEYHGVEVSGWTPHERGRALDLFDEMVERFHSEEIDDDVGIHLSWHNAEEFGYDAFEFGEEDQHAWMTLEAGHEEAKWFLCASDNHPNIQAWYTLDGRTPAWFADWVEEMSKPAAVVCHN